MGAFFVPIVEGHGELEAVPNLLHRIVRHLGGPVPRINPPIRIKRGSFINNASEFSRHTALAASKAAQNEGTVLILLDADDDCPANLGPQLLERARAIRNDVDYIVALAVREYESWFISAAASLAGSCGLDADLTAPAEIHRIRDAKGWLGSRMQNGYDPIRDQLLMTRAFSLDEAVREASFARLVERIRNLD